jgi:hypothetical protein
MTACAHDVPSGLWCPDCALFALLSPLAAAAFFLGMLVSGCGNVAPRGIQSVPRAELEAKHAVWVELGKPPCREELDLLLVVAQEDERRERCCTLDMTPDQIHCRAHPPGSCLIHFRRRGTIIKLRPAAVVSPEFIPGWIHEFVHWLSGCALGDVDAGHQGSQWDVESRRKLDMP